MKFGLTTKEIETILNEIQLNLGATKDPQVYVFGSRAKGTHRDFSDIDLLLKATSYDVEALENIDFERLDIVYKVDFVLDKDLFEGYRNDVESNIVPFKP